MIHAVTAANAPLYRDQLDHMHRMRHEMYVVQRGWSGLTSENGREVDEYDTDEAVYLMNLSPEGELLSTFRLMPTSSPYLLQKLNQFVIGEPPASPKIWDMTRWMIAPGQRKKKGEVRSQAQAYLACGLFEFACTRGLTHYTTLMDLPFLPLVEAAGWTYEPIGLPMPYEDGKGMAIAVRIETGPKALAHVRMVCEIDRPVLFEAPPATSGLTTADVMVMANMMDAYYSIHDGTAREVLGDRWMKLASTANAIDSNAA